MDSIYGEDGIDDLLGDGVQEREELPSGDETENLFVEENEDNNASEPIKLEPKKRSVRTPRLRLTVETLKGPRGIHTIEDYFHDIKFKGKGYEKQDLDEVLHRLQHWAHRMFPTYKFDDVLTQIEVLGKKKPLQVHMSRYRLGLLEAEKVACTEDANEPDECLDQDDPFDEFDALLGEQIAISKLVPRTPVQNSRNFINSTLTNSMLGTSFSHGNAVISTPHPHLSEPERSFLNDSEPAQPLHLSQSDAPNTIQASKQLNAEQLARIAENRRIAQERLHAKKLQDDHSKQ